MSARKDPAFPLERQEGSADLPSRLRLLAARLLARHPELDEFLQAPRTALVSIELERASHVEDFQRVSETASWKNGGKQA